MKHCFRNAREWAGEVRWECHEECELDFDDFMDCTWEVAGRGEPAELTKFNAKLVIAAHHIDLPHEVKEFFLLQTSKTFLVTQPLEGSTRYVSYIA